MLYAPVDGTVKELRLDGKKTGFFGAEHDGRPVAGLTLYLKPGQARELVYDVVTGEQQAGKVDFRVTRAYPAAVRARWVRARVPERAGPTRRTETLTMPTV